MEKWKKDCTISFLSNFYYLLPKYIDKDVEIWKENNTIFISYNNTIINQYTHLKTYKQRYVDLPIQIEILENQCAKEGKKIDELEIQRLAKQTLASLNIQYKIKTDTNIKDYDDFFRKKMNELINLLKEIKWVTIDKVEQTLLKEKYSNVLIKDFLYEILKEEIEFKSKRREYLKVKTGGFGSIKTINDFDFSFQPQINKNLINYLLTFRFVDKCENIIFYGTPGVGKTHLAIAIGGIEAAKSKLSVYFIDGNKLINNLKEAKRKNQLDIRIKHYSKYKLLIIDELGFLPMDQETANIMFQLVNSRYLKNQPLSLLINHFQNEEKCFKMKLLQVQYYIDFYIDLMW